MFYNSHIHTFTDQDVPDRFLPLGLVKILRGRTGYWIIKNMMGILKLFANKDEINRYLKFVTIGRLDSQEQIFLECKKYYPELTRFIILSMNMHHMGAGNVPRNFNDQLKELSVLSIKYPAIYPFIHIDPREPFLYQSLKNFHMFFRFKGVKLYPPLGYFPYDPRLDLIYQYCQDNNLPVISHCSPANPVHFKGSRKELLELLKVSAEPIVTKGKSCKELCANFTHPNNFLDVIRRFPKLRICFAHFGSEMMWDRYIANPDDKDNWLMIIRNLIKSYPNFYTDVSFTLEETKYFSLLKVFMTDEQLADKILFGSDYYMVETEADERRFGIDLRASLGEDNFYKISKINVEKFLGIE